MVLTPNPPMQSMIVFLGGPSSDRFCNSLLSTLGIQRSALLVVPRQVGPQVWQVWVWAHPKLAALTFLLVRGWGDWGPGLPGFGRAFLGRHPSDH